MAAPSLLTASSSTTDASSYNTASISPSRHVWAYIQSRRGAGVSAAPTISGLTQVVTFNPVGSALNRRITVLKGGGLGTGALTIDFGGSTQDHCTWIVWEADEDTAVQTATGESNSATGLTINLAAFADAANLGFGCFAKTAVEGITPEAGATEIGETSVAENVTTAQAQYKANDASVSASGISTLIWWGVAIEAAVGAAPSGHPTMRRWGGIPGMRQGGYGRSW